MKRTLGYLKPYAGRTALALFLKTAGSVSELVLPYLLSYIIDELTPLKDETAIWIAGGAMLFFSRSSATLPPTAFRRSSRGR